MEQSTELSLHITNMLMDKFSEENMYTKFCDAVLGVEDAAQEQRVHLL